jgi:hypothetical protein
MREMKSRRLETSTHRKRRYNGEDRHIAYRAEDVDAMAKFFVDAMGMKMIQKRKNNAIDLERRQRPILPCCR